MNDKLGMIAFGKVKALEKRLKTLEIELERIKRESLDEENFLKSQTSSEEVRDN